MDLDRTYLVGEVALIAMLPRDTLRVWLRRDYFEFDRPSGWKRFTFLETLTVCVFAEVVRRTKDHEVARQVASIEFENWFQNDRSASDCFVEFWRNRQEELMVEQLVGLDRAQSVLRNSALTETHDTFFYGFLNLSAIRQEFLGRMQAYQEGRLNEDGELSE